MFYEMQERESSNSVFLLDRDTTTQFKFEESSCDSDEENKDQVNDLPLDPSLISITGDSLKSSFIDNYFD